MKFYHNNNNNNNLFIYLFNIYVSKITQLSTIFLFLFRPTPYCNTFEKNFKKRKKQKEQKLFTLN